MAPATPEVYEGTPCFRGHSGVRYLKSRHCVECKKIRGKERVTRRGEWQDPEKKYWTRIFRKYGIRVEDYNRMLAEQGGVCAICKDSSRSGYRLAVDHCHESGNIRGLLCQSCNAGIGQLKDSLAILMAAMQYLSRHKAQPINESGIIPFPTTPRAAGQVG